MVIKRIGVLKLAIFQCLVMAMLGVLIALVMMLFGSMIGGLIGHNAGAAGMLGGLIMLIILPILYGVLGFIAGAIGAFLYNLVAGWVGGIEMDVDLAAPAVSQP